MSTDAELARAFRDGDDRAFSVLYERFMRPLYAFAIRMLSNEDAARDLVQDVFLRIYERRLAIEEPERFRSWLYAIGRNRCISQLRRRRESTSLDQVTDHAIAYGSFPAEGIDSAVEREESVRLIRLAIAALKPEYREVLILREYQDLPYSEIADITESSEGAVKSRLFKARRTLHDILRTAFADRR